MLRLFSSLALLVVIAGCNSEPFALAPAAGKITLNGEPLPDAAILFQPLVPDGGNPLEVGPESGAHSKPDGTFEMRTFVPERNGAVVGKHRVIVSLPKEEGQAGAPVGPDGATIDGVYKPVKYTLPLRYRDGSALTVEIPADGKTDLVIALTTP